LKKYEIEIFLTRIQDEVSNFEDPDHYTPYLNQFLQQKDQFQKNGKNLHLLTISIYLEGLDEIQMGVISDISDTSLTLSILEDDYDENEHETDPHICSSRLISLDCIQMIGYEY